MHEVLIIATFKWAHPAFIEESDWQDNYKTLITVLHILGKIVSPWFSPESSAWSRYFRDPKLKLQPDCNS